MSIYERGDVYWCDFTVNGKRYRYSTGQKVKTKAAQWEKDKIAEIKGESNAASLYQKIKQNLVDSQIDFNQAWECFEKYPRKKHSETQTGQYLRVWNDFTAFCQSKNKAIIAEIDEKTALDYIALLRLQGRFSPITYERNGKQITNNNKTKKPSPHTINFYASTLKLIFNVLR